MNEDFSGSPILKLITTKNFYVEIRHKLLSVLDKNLVDEYNFQRYIADSNMVEIIACLIKKSEIDRLAENSLTLQPRHSRRIPITLIINRGADLRRFLPP